MQNRKSILRVVTVGLFAALVFAGNYLSFPIPVAVGNVTRIHLGNVLCLLAGFIAGPIGGGLASGIGGALYDMMNPAYIADAPFTFLFKFLLAFVCGLAAHGGKLTGGIPNTAEVKIPRRIAAGVLGSVTYIVLYIGKNFIEALLLGNAPEVAALAQVTRLATSTVNAVLAVVLSVPLSAALCKALRSLKLSDT